MMFGLKWRVLAVASDGESWWIEEFDSETEAHNLAYDLAMLSGATYKVEYIDEMSEV